MGFSEHQVGDGGLELETKKWVIAGIPLRAPLKPIYTITAAEKEIISDSTTTTSAAAAAAAVADDDDDGEECSTTPTSEEARITPRFVCPPAPRKRKATLKCNYGVREFFTPPDLESVFIVRHVERAS